MSHSSSGALEKLAAGVFTGTNSSIEETTSNSHQSLGESSAAAIVPPIFNSAMFRNVSPLLVEEEPSLHETIDATDSRPQRFIQDTCLEPPAWEYPKLTRHDIKLDKFLGRGCFSKVQEIRSISVSPSSSMDPPPRQRSNSVASDDKESRQFIAEHCTRPSGDARYALKHVRDELRSHHKKFTIAVIDLKTEAFFLKRLQHAHIIKLRATVHDMNGLSGLVLDRLYDTLATRMGQWKKGSSKSLGFLGRWSHKGHKNLGERIEAAFHLSSALRYLHDNKVVHRDIKPENIGFDIRSDIKLFDFGLAKELFEKDSYGNGLYKLSRMTGTLRYMAPEVYLGEAYNQKCDVYSFALVLWEMLALEQAYNSYNDEKSFVTSILKGACRPSLKRKWPTTIRQLLTKAWVPSINDRLSAKAVNETLRKELILLGKGDDSDLDHTRRRSTFVFGRKSVRNSPQSSAHSSD